jgi:kumamolisin
MEAEQDNADTADVSDTHVSVHSYAQVLQRPPCKPYFKIAKVAAARAAASQTWTVPELCTAYNWPTGLTGRGVIGIVELDGGWVKSDLEKFFTGIGQPLPHIVDVSVDGTKNNPNQHLGDPASDPDGEVALDIEVAGAAYYAATQKAASIRMYWSQDIASAVRAATADGCDVFSISWGADEAMWGTKAGHDMENAAAAATKAGMVVFAASGDNDSSDGGSTPANVDLPASAPHVIGCGGTQKTTKAETVWNEDPGNPSGEGTGGGYSTLFKPMPAWQAGAPHGPGRMVPDVAADADPDTGINVLVHGKKAVFGGTSAVAPLYAGLFAAFGTKLGFVTPQLWLNHMCFNDITSGDNGHFRARSGPDACTGLGSPIGTKLSHLLTHPASKPSRQLQDLEDENQRLKAAIAELMAKQT